MKSHSVLTVGQLAEQGGTTAKTIRFYEQAGLIPPAERADNGYRTYAEADIKRLRFIRVARTLDFSLNDLREILALRDHGERPCQQVMSILNARLSDINSQMRQLRALRNELQTLIQTAETLPLNPRDDEECVCNLIDDEPHAPRTSMPKLQRGRTR